MSKPQALENAEDKDSFVDELKPGTKLLHGQYTIESFLNAGGFGITYLARDSLDRKIVIKECFPGAFCRRSRYIVQARSRAHQNELKSIVRLFVQEARSLAKLDHPNIVGVHQVFEDNDTAYMALDFIEGHDLLEMIEEGQQILTPAQIRTILREMLGAVGFIHDQGMLHRDISPDNILINKSMRPVLIDFGAAREQATKQSRVLSAMRVVKDGYSPQEFYIAGSEQGPSSDLYALAASFYHLISKDVPANSQARLAAIASGEPDPYQKLSGRIKGYDENFLASLDKALAVLPKDRLQSAKAWLDMMDGVQGNVTSLNVAGGKGASSADKTASRSRMPLLLGSAAVLAVVVGGGVFMTRSDPVAEVAVTAAPVMAETTTDQATALAATPDVVAPVLLTDMPDAVQDPVLDAELPVMGNMRATIETVLPPDLPDTPTTIAEIGTGPDVAITAIIPGNEMPPAGLVADWSVQLPFAAAGPSSNIIAQTDPDAPDWVQPGVIVTDVNATDIGAIADIVTVLRDDTDMTSDMTELAATFGTRDPTSGERTEHDLTLPVVQRFALSNEIAFETAFIGDRWQTIVTAAPADTSGGLQAGDIVTSYIPTSETLTERDSLLEIFNQGTENGTDRYTFAVQRDGSMWVASMTYTSDGQ